MSAGVKWESPAERQEALGLREECPDCGGHGYKRAGHRGVARANDRAAQKCALCNGEGSVLT